MLYYSFAFIFSTSSKVDPIKVWKIRKLMNGSVWLLSLINSNAEVMEVLLSFKQFIIIQTNILAAAYVFKRPAIHI